MDGGGHQKILIQPLKETNLRGVTFIFCDPLKIPKILKLYLFFSISLRATPSQIFLGKSIRILPGTS